MNLPAGVTARQDLEVAPKSAPLSTEGLNALAKQRQREADELAAQVARRQEAEQREQEEAERQNQARAQAEERKRQEAAQEAQKWEIINAQAKPTGHQLQPCYGFDRVIQAQELNVPMLVGGDLLVKPLGITLEVFTLDSPVVDSVSAMLLEPLYLDEAQRRWDANLERTRELMGDGPWLYTAALPSVSLVDAGPINPRTERPAATHKIVRAIWGDCFIHNPHHQGADQ